MMKRLLMVLMVCMTATGFSVEQGSFEGQAQKYRWFCNSDTNLPNVLILGDSVSIGYTLGVRKQLDGIANVYRPVIRSGENRGRPQNCMDTATGLNKLPEWLAMADHWDVICFNWGLHDLRRNNGFHPAGSPDMPCNISLDKYEANLQQIVQMLKKTGATLIFATTTPFPAGVVPCRLPEDAPRYNAVATKVMEQNGIEINDLYELTKGSLAKIQKPANVHFNDDGNKLLAEAVADKISAALKKGK